MALNLNRPKKTQALQTSSQIKHCQHSTNSNQPANPFKSLRGLFGPESRKHASQGTRQPSGIAPNNQTNHSLDFQTNTTFKSG